MLGNEKLLFDELYEKTKDCGRVQFVELLMTKERENKELKKQLEEERNKVREYSYKLSNFRCEETYENQQKEFINYLEDMLEDENDIFSVVRVKDVLSKYKEIIGVSDENNIK